MWPLEYAMLFGVPDNKIELLEGGSRWAFPFTSRELAEAHFDSWLETLCRWKALDPKPEVRKGKRRWRVKTKPVVMRLFPRPIEFRFRMAWKAFDGFLKTFVRPEMWPGDWPAWHRGMLGHMDHSDVQMNLWQLFGELCHRHGGLHSGRVDIAFSDTAAVAPDHYYYRASRQECTIDGDYFHGVPLLIAEVLSPPSVQFDRGPRRELYRRSGLPFYWILDPVLETIELYKLVERQFRHEGTYRPGDRFRHELFPGEEFDVARLFDTQCKRHGDRDEAHKQAIAKPISEWIIPPEVPLGLEHFFLLGHPERRWEIWGNKAPSILAFGSATEAQARLPRFLEEAARWEAKSLPKIAALGPDTEQAEVGRFTFTRTGRHIRLDVTVDARRYVDLLKVWTQREAWDWGER